MITMAKTPQFLGQSVTLQPSALNHAEKSPVWVLPIYACKKQTQSRSEISNGQI